MLKTNKFLMVFSFMFFSQLSFASQIKIDFGSAFVNVVDPNNTAPAVLFDLVGGYLIFDSTTPDTNSTSIPDGSGVDDFGQFLGAITDISVAFNGLEFRLDSAFSNVIETEGYSSSFKNFHLEATAKLKSSNGTMLDFLFSTQGNGFRGGIVPNQLDSLPSAGDFAGGSAFIMLSNLTDQYELTTDIAVAPNAFYTVVPIPAALWLFGSGFLGLIGVASRKYYKSE